MPNITSINNYNLELELDIRLTLPNMANVAIVRKLTNFFEQQRIPTNPIRRNTFASTRRNTIASAPTNVSIKTNHNKRINNLTKLASFGTNTHTIISKQSPYLLNPNTCKLFCNIW